jgi:hypothetical protein
MPIPASRPEGIARPPAALSNQPGTPAQTGNPSQPGTPPVHVGAVATPPAGTAPVANLPHSLLDKPAEVPRVTLNGGSLAVDAHNSSLGEILKDLEKSSGMTVDGFDKDTRVFGVYGPGPPSDVISALLDGAGYNFLLVGATEAGTPREILLTTRGNAPISAPQPSSSQPQEDDEPVNVPPVEAPPVQPQPPTDQPRQPRTPQEMLQELQRIRQQQQQPGQPPATTPQ